MVFEWIRFGISALFIVAGLFVLGVAVFGIYRLSYVLNRIHVAAKCDTLGALLVVVGLMISCTTWSSALHLLVVIMFMWLTNPVASHLVVRLEVISQPSPTQEYEELSDDTV